MLHYIKMRYRIFFWPPSTLVFVLIHQAAISQCLFCTGCPSFRSQKDIPALALYLKHACVIALLQLAPINLLYCWVTCSKKLFPKHSGFHNFISLLILVIPHVGSLRCNVLGILWMSHSVYSSKGFLHQTQRCNFIAQHIKRLQGLCYLTVLMLLCLSGIQIHDRRQDLYF